MRPRARAQRGGAWGRCSTPVSWAGAHPRACARTQPHTRQHLQPRPCHARRRLSSRGVSGELGTELAGTASPSRGPGGCRTHEGASTWVLLPPAAVPSDARTTPHTARASAPVPTEARPCPPQPHARGSEDAGSSRMAPWPARAPSCRSGAASGTFLSPRPAPEQEAARGELRRWKERNVLGLALRSPQKAALGGKIQGKGQGICHSRTARPPPRGL